MKIILGVRHGHDSSACLLVDGRIIADVAEERFTRKKNDGSFPENAINYCLEVGEIDSWDLDAVAIPTISVSETINAFFPQKKSLTFKDKNKINIKQIICRRSENSRINLPVYYKVFPVRENCKFITVHHHLAHASSAYYTSGIHSEKSLVVVMDGLGDGWSTSIWRGENNKLTLIKNYDSNSSLAWFYAAATEALDWRHGSDEWKTMGLAPYGKAIKGILDRYHPVFDGGELVNFHDFGTPSRFPDHGCNHYHLKDAKELKKIVTDIGRENFAAEVQRIAEEQAENLIYPILKKENTRNLCCAGGFFLNVKFNQRVWYSGNVDHQWIYPNSGDSGIACGAALYVYYVNNPGQKIEKLTTQYLGPEYNNNEIESILKDRKLNYNYYPEIVPIIAEKLAENKIIAWFQGRMEAGPRALGNRSILMSPLNLKNKDIINACVKYRESFRPFTPSILYEKADEYLVKPREEMYMITSFEVKRDAKDRIPAVVHVDGTARPQMVKREMNPLYYDLIKKFGDLTGEYVLLNTSFNVKGEPIICGPREAIKCFYDTGLDILVISNFMLEK